MNVRMKFKKEGPIRFIGHLDLMRTFQKLFMRSGIPVAYSEGFNPHQIFSFATALAVGVSSEGEYIDLRLKEEVPVEVLIQVINAHAPRGIEMTDGVVLQAKEPKAMAALAAGRYMIRMNGTKVTQAMVDALMNSEEIMVQKKNKKGKIKDLDLKSGIYELKVEDDTIEMLIATGSAFNIKPELLLQKLYEVNELTFDRSEFDFHRVELYHENDGLKSLLDTKIKL